MPARVRLVTLSTDLGSAYTAQMKGVLYRTLPPGSVVELTHDLPRHQVEESAFLLRHLLTAFPAGAVHLVVVDPGVGGARAPLAIQTNDGSYLVGPDNGVLSLAADRLGLRRAVRLDPLRFGATTRVGRTFDGRDLFAPAAARLARGGRLTTLGSGWKPRTLALPEPSVRSGSVSGVILHVDHFGNAITNVPTSLLRGRPKSVRVKVGRRSALRVPVVGVYEELRPGQPGVLGSSFGTVEFALRERSAASRLGLTVGDQVTLRWSRPNARAVGGK